MKKASSVILLITVAFLCVMIGILVGRRTAGNYHTVSQADMSVSISATDKSVFAGKLDINTADVSALSDLPGIGPVLAQRIIDYRTENGDFKNIEDLLCVKGIGQKRLDEIRELISTGG